MKKVKGFRLSDDVLKEIERIAKEKGMTQTQIIEKAIKCLIENERKDNKELELLQEQNKNMQIALNSLKIALESKEEVINEKERLLKEREERIKELQERLKAKNKPFWKFW